MAIVRGPEVVQENNHGPCFADGQKNLGIPSGGTAGTRKPGAEQNNSTM